MRCHLCGLDFDARHLACHTACPLHQYCTVICCPNCGYQTVDTSRSKVVAGLRRIAARLGPSPNKESDQ
jgi:hypothetical protein